MVDIIQPLDFLGRMGGMANMPNLIGNADAVTQQREREAATIDALQARAMAEQAQAQAAQQEQIDAQRFQNDLATFGDGSPKSIVMMMQRNPKYAKLLSDAHALEKADIQEADTLFLNSIYARAANGDFAGAAAQARRRLEAEKAAGNDTTDEQAMVDQLESGDPVLQQRAMRVIGGDLAGRVGLDKFAAVYGGVTTADGNIVNRGTGDVTYQGKPEVRGVVMAGGVDEYGNPQPSRLVNPVTGETIGGSVPASSGGAGAAPASTPATGSRAARNNNPGNLEASEWTQSQPGYVGTDGRFAIFDTPANGAAAMTSLLANNYLAKGINTIGGIISKYAPRSDGNNVNAYVGAVSKATGIKPNQPLTPDDLPAVVAAMAQVEGGGYGAAPAGRERTPKELAYKYGAPAAGYQWVPDGSRQIPVKGGPADPTVSRTGGLKQLPANEVEKLASEAENIAQMSDLVASFKPAFSGIGSRGGNMIAALGFGDATQNAQHDWWQSMEAVDNVVRNQLFGASLTAGEQNAWERTTVTPNMSPERITANLKRREAILKRALDRKVKVLGAAGYKADIGAALNSGATVAPSSPVASGWSIRKKGAQ